jgi:hypothetical protein
MAPFRAWWCLWRLISRGYPLTYLLRANRPPRTFPTTRHLGRSCSSYFVARAQVRVGEPDTARDVQISEWP